MNFNEAINRLEIEWDVHGFFENLRSSHYDAEAAKEIIDILRAINVDDEQNFPKRLIALLWYMPSFLRWQIERVEERGEDKGAYERFITEVHNTLEEVLGTP